MIKFQSVLVAVLTGILMSAQAQRITWVNGNKDVVPIHSIVGYDDGGYYLYRYTKERYANSDYYHGDFIEKRSFDGKLIFSKSADYSEGGNDFYFSGIYLMKSGPFVINYDEQTKNYCAIKMNSDGSMTDKKVVLCPAVLIRGVNAKKMPEFPYNGSVSNDKAYFVGYYYNYTSKVSVKVLDDAMNVKWSKDAQFPISGKFDIIKALTDGNKAYFLVSVKGAKDRPMYSMITIDGASGSVKKTELNPEGSNAIVSGDFRIAKNGDIMLTVLYQKQMPAGVYFEDWGAIGYAIMRIDPNSSKVTLDKATSFEKDLILKYVSEKKYNKGRGIDLLKIKDVIENPDNSLVILTEQSMGGAFGGSNGSAGVTDYLYKDIVIIKLNSDGSQAWVKNIHKKQDDGFPYFSDMTLSFGYYVTGSTMYIIYNDNSDNAKLSPEEMDKEGDDIKKTQSVASSDELMIEKVDLSDGSMTRKVLGHQYDRKNDNTLVFCDLIKQMGDKLVVYRSDLHKKKEQFGEVIFQQ